MKTLLETIGDFFWVLVHPDFWIMNHPYSEAWDTRLNQLMDENKFIIEDSYEASIGGVVVWINNYPYAAFTPSPLGSSGIRVRPKCRTIKKAYKRLLNDQYATGS